MEQKLGRYLKPGETVHHKNCNKGDNRSKNLELWQGRHPTGYRKSDKKKPYEPPRIIMGIHAENAQFVYPEA